MSKETQGWLNSHILIGLGFKPWWLDETLVTPGNLYDGPIPVEDVLEKLFHWEPEAWATQAFSAGSATQRKTIKDAKRYAIVRPPASFGPDDPGSIFYYGGQESYRVHTRREWLTGTVEALLGPDVVIESAGELADGAESFVCVSVPEDMTHAGVVYRPRVTLATSANGRLATQGAAHTHVTQCDNTLAANLGGGHREGRGIKIRHSANSVTNATLTRYAEALGILQRQGEDFARTVELLSNTPVSEDQWQKFLNAYAGDVTELEGRAVAFAETARAALNAEWMGDNLTSAPWAGTAFGALQAANTYAHHSAIRRGGIDNRVQANIRESITGEWGEHDDRALEALLKAGVMVPVLAR